jgi:hypothetical protein
MSKDKYLVDYHHGKDNLRLIKIYQTVAKILLKYGCKGQNSYNITDDRIREYWHYDEPFPSFSDIHTKIHVPEIKKVISNMEISGKIWNNDFLHGILKHTIMTKPNRGFSSVKWYYNDNVKRLLELSPFGGNISVVKDCPHMYSWTGAPAVNLHYNPKSLSFLAGLLAPGIRYVKDGISYAKYSKRVKPYIEELKIPIEREVSWKNTNMIFISPVWPALLSLLMPKTFRRIWQNVRNPCNADLYCPILWKTYVGLGDSFPAKSIPFLRSRQKIFNDYKCEEGVIKKMDQLRLETNLVELDYRFREAVHMWAKESSKYKDAKI